MTGEKNRRESCVSYSKSDNHIANDEPSDLVEEHVQLSLDPKLQAYLAQVSRESGCWGTFFPIPFERAAQKSWWDPTFDSEILEDQYKKSSNPHSRFKFRCALWYMVLVSSSWLVYFLITGIIGDTRQWWLLCTVLTALLITLTIAIFLTYTKIFNHHMISLSLAIAILLAVLSLAFLIVIQPPPVGHFSICIQILILIYTLIPLKLYMSISAGVTYSILFELLTSFLQPALHNDTLTTVIVRLISHIAIHLIGLYILVMSNVRMRNTFMKVGQSLLVRRQLEAEKRLKENMIHSLMPPSVADWLLHEDDNFTRRHSSDSTNDIRSLFRPFNMDHMDNVSILFADIVGFTRMSSNKSAEQLVEILNNLFQRFDDLCKFHNCEKISTLGDCYYCVSGCPEARADHAQCCVEMGLNMIKEIKQFDEENNEGVNMRVGVHTGTVLCGIVGTRRFKFDVWSNDVTLANRMESTGRPGMVHISEKTKSFLQDMYILEEGDNVFGLNTYFILGRKGDKTPSYCGSFRAEGRQKYTNSLQLFVSPPTLSPSLSPQTRPRVLSCDTTSTLSKPIHNSNMLSPDICRIKASSLPSILDSENEQDSNNETNLNPNPEDGCLDIKTPTSTASSGKYSVKLNWKIPKFMRKSSDQRNNTELEFSSINPPTTLEDGYQQVPTIADGVVPSINGKKKESFISVIESPDDDQKETIDVKSYISQSRSDIGQYDYTNGSEFLRTASYRSQYSRSPNDMCILQRTGSNRSRRGRSPNFDGLEPTERARSATMTVPNLRRDKKSLDATSRLSNIPVFDEHSINSRKDSGIKSNSRRSSIIQLENAFLCTDIMQHRVSGYYTSSQSTVNSPADAQKNPGPFFEKFGIQNLRKQSDRQLIKCVQDNSKSRSSYFIQPPLSQITLFFKDKKMEQEYRDNVHSPPNENHHNTPTLANSRFNTYLDVFVSVLIFLFVSIGVVLIYGATPLWVATFVAFLFVQGLGFALCFTKVVRFADNLLNCTTRFYRWNMFGAILVSLPLLIAIIIFVTDTDTTFFHQHLYTYLLFVGLVHFCNFTQLNCWMKNMLATVCSIIFIGMFVSRPCSSKLYQYSANLTYSEDNPGISSPYFNHNITNFDMVSTTNSTIVNNILDESPASRCYLYKSEVLMNLCLLIILVWLLNREFEISYRLSFHANYVANRDKIHVQRLKNQADYLIYNIVPKHVAEDLKKDAKYSENFKDVAIIFASIVNFNEMYDESYEGGREFLRVLNELIGDFDELLDRPEFHCVEKIKTIGSTFMAASGLNSRTRAQQQNPHDHLYALVDFALEMQKVVNDFNQDLLEFNLILRVGYNFGEVTAAVIGNTKLYYDIWGDAVNIASRMDSTGVNGNIQVGENCLPVLEKQYVLEPRGSVYVKGKDNMNVYLLLRKRTPDQLTVPGMM